MRTAFFFVWLGMSVLGAAAQVPAGAVAGGGAATAGGVSDEVKRLHGIYEENLKKVAAARLERVRALDEKYLATLKTLQKQAQKQGRLDGVLAAEAEIGRVEKGGAVPEEGDEAFEALARARAVYRAAWQEEAARANHQVADLAQKYCKALEWQERDLTRRGLTAEAMAVRELRRGVLEGEGAPAGGLADVTQRAGAAVEDGLYMVVDLSGGVGAERYPVSYLAAVPKGGWTDVYKTDKLVLRKIKAGTFVMGSPESEMGRNSFLWAAKWADEKPHTVTLTGDYYIGVFEVTQRQWELVMGDRPSYYDHEASWATRPVENGSNFERIRGRGVDFGASWPRSHRVSDGSFLQRLRDKTGVATFDLPTEAQWEYACRAGTRTALNNGKDLAEAKHDPSMDALGRYRFNSGGSEGKIAKDADASKATAKVGSYAPNAWGLYDMHGNVWEWCLDRPEEYAGDAKDPQGASEQAGSSQGLDFVRRGGAYCNNASDCRSAVRYWNYAKNAYNEIGFRLAMTVR